jgi:hypothetical protein
VRPTARRLVFALVPAVLLFGGVEVALRLSGFTPVTAAEVAATEGFYGGAYVHRRDMEARPWFVVEGGQARSNPRLVPRGFHDQAFPVVPPAGERRLFALGGSTTQGAPYEDRTRGFSELLEARLGEGTRVVNAGVAGLDSSRFPELAREAVDLGATGLVVYAGHNEISGRLIDRCLAPERVGVAWVVEKVRTLRVLQAWTERVRGVAPPTAEALREHQDDCMRAALDRGLAEHGAGTGPQRADAVAQETVTGFARALAEVAEIAVKADVPLWLGVPVANLREPPVGPRANPALDADTARAVDAAWRRVQRGEAVDLDALIARDPTHAGLRWARGMALLEADPAAARLDLQAAVDWDYQGTRVTTPLVAAVRHTCEAWPGVSCVDVAGAFEAAAPDGIPGEALFVDHCHPTWEGGTPLISEAFAAAIEGSAP